MAWKVDIPDAEFYTLQDPRLEAIVREVCDQKIVAIDTETTGLIIWRDMPLFWSLSWGRRRICMPADTLHRFMSAFEDYDKTWVFANAKYDMHILANVGITLKGKIVDTQVMHCLLYEEQPHRLDYMGKQLLGWEWKDMFDGWDKRKQPNIGDFIMDLYRNDPRKLIEYASNDAYGTMQIYDKLKVELEESWVYSLYPEHYKTLWDIFIKTEAPFTKVLWKCERAGIYVDKEFLLTLEGPVAREINDLKKELNALYQAYQPGVLFNPNSTLQKRDWFFNFEGLKAVKLGKAGAKTGVRNPSCDAEFLDHYKGESKMAKLLLRFAELDKLHGTYLVGLRESDSIDSQGFIHTRYNQDVARTGRLSCVAGWTPVRTTRGAVAMENIRPGDSVWTHKGRWQQVTAFLPQGERHVYDVRLSNGYVLTCTTDHRLLLSDGCTWATIEEVTDGVLEDLDQQPEEQRARQPRGCDAAGPQDRSLLAGEGHGLVVVEAIDYRGVLEVYDISVDGDESYEACGVFAHNCSDPNLQNMPNPERDKFKTRKAFRPKPSTKRKLIAADYDQLEMRLLACAAMEPPMIDIFLQGKDIHIGNASLVFGLPYDDIKAAKDKEKNELNDYDHTCLLARQNVKAIGYGLNYGMKEFKLASDLGIRVEEAKALMDKYMSAYPAVERFFAEAVDNARITGYSFTVMGRRRFLPEIISRRNQERSKAERQAGNFEIQGSAADVVRMAMILLDDAQLDKRYDCIMRLQVHDELVFDCPEETLTPAMGEIVEWMEHALHTDLPVPLKVSAKAADNWADAH